MQFRDISQDKDTLYALKENEQAVFFMENRAGEITFDLAGKGAAAHIFAIFIEEQGAKDLSLTQKHSARETASHASVRSVLGGNAEVNYRGLIRIESGAGGSDASQESRALLLSDAAKHSTRPSLEILPKDVTCHHKASASPLNKESLYYLESRGLSKKDAAAVLINGFLGTTFEAMRDLGVPEETLTRIQNAAFDKLLKLYA
ncbi:MAG: hypothetical protein A2808_02720 [Candidatus Moranbacteria bacterium RIFCSPHIGHO2_01_FULL_55_24]|nr:MAG: hypothetical protein A2808_02720 [Candidatus Moranbacteria bacterium RIFCSPHIGHO2_01_FULL_55_24]